MITRKKKETDAKEALRKLAALCAKAEHSSGEMMAKMALWQVEPSERQAILDRLIDGKYVDDERFARMFARDKLRFDHWGRRKIDQALYKKGVEEGVRRRVLDAISDDDFVEVLRPLLAAKRRSIAASDDYEAGAKLARFALGRGFSMDQIRRCGGPGADYADDHDDA